ncbi:MAG: phosphoribosyltransferase [Chloroflexota bacterium]
MHESGTVPFDDRVEAGRLVAALLGNDPVGFDIVLGIPRGGVIVAAEVARALDLPLDVFLVRKLGAPDQPELALGALAETGHLELNQAVVSSLKVEPSILAHIMSQERLEIDRRLDCYRPRRTHLHLRGVRVLVVDDGVATGATTLVALRAIKAEQTARLVLAVPVCPQSTLERLEREADRVLVLATPQPFGAVGAWYRDFRQVTDEEVTAALQSVASHRLHGC